MSEIFISYKREDQAEARTLATNLEASGWSVWWDPQLRSGDHFDDVIERELKMAKCVIVLWSHRSVKSQYVKDEASYALKLNKLIPVAIDDAEPPFRFQGLHTLSLSGWDGSPKLPAFQKLVSDIAGLLWAPVAKNTKPSPKPRETEKPREEPEEQPNLLRSTATYGQEFKPADKPDRYSFRIYVGGFAGPKTADERAKEEIRGFMRKETYPAYEIVNRRYNFFPSYYEYTVQFRRK